MCCCIFASSVRPKTLSEKSSAGLTVLLSPCVYELSSRMDKKEKGIMKLDGLGLFWKLPTGALAISYSN